MYISTLFASCHSYATQDSHFKPHAESALHSLNIVGHIDSLELTLFLLMKMNVGHIDIQPTLIFY